MMGLKLNHVSKRGHKGERRIIPMVPNDTEFALPNWQTHKIDDGVKHPCKFKYGIMRSHIAFPSDNWGLF